ncbi:sodium/hydrogen exchanger 3 isoform X1 [Arachis hypogaea]|uniref:sodium/hydrogen exchanger 3 isoform X1 n=1 Tax=Arachis hypogaea TaxID=3818 RepID=UPI003B221F95
MDALDIEKWRFISQSPEKSVGISSVLLGVILVERAAFVFPLSFLSNLLQKSPHVKIDLKQQVTIWWSSLMRGAVSIAVAYNQLKRQENYSYMVVISTNSFPSYTRVQISISFGGFIKSSPDRDPTENLDSATKWNLFRFDF